MGVLLVAGESGDTNQIPTNEVPRLTSTKSEHPTTDKVLAEIRMDEVPLEDAIRRLAADAHLNIILDPRLSDPTYGAPGRFLAKWPISFHFRNVTASQALRALLDNYGLMLTDEPGVSQRITAPESAQEKAKPRSA
jgi:hypothetical protein